MRPPSYRGIVEELAEAIRLGQLPAGTRLPAHRRLARERHIALATASRVYAELAALGLVVGEVGRGTFVRVQAGYDGIEPNRMLSVPRVADLSSNQPVAAGQVDQLRRVLRELSVSGEVEALLRQDPPGGRRGDRAVVATYLLGRGIDVSPAQVLLGNGTQHVLDSALRALVGPGDVLAVDVLTYPGIKLLAAAHRLDLTPIPITPAGPDLDALEDLCRIRPIRAIYTIPTVHNPLGWVLDDEQRYRLVSIAGRHDVAIIEDGTYAFLDSAPPVPLRTLAPERTCYVASLSKNVATGLRFGFATVPDRLAAAVTHSLRASAWGTPGLVTAVATRWLADGTVARLEQARRQDATDRQDIARCALSGMDLSGHPTSYLLWLRLQPHQRPDQVAQALASEGILVSTGDAFATGPHPPAALRLALATPPIEELKPVLCRLRAAIEGIAP